MSLIIYRRLTFLCHTKKLADTSNYLMPRFVFLYQAFVPGWYSYEDIENILCVYHIVGLNFSVGIFVHLSTSYSQIRLIGSELGCPSPYGSISCIMCVHTLHNRTKDLFIVVPASWKTIQTHEPLDNTTRSGLYGGRYDFSHDIIFKNRSKEVRKSHNVRWSR